MLGLLVLASALLHGLLLEHALKSGEGGPFQLRPRPMYVTVRAATATQPAPSAAATRARPVLHGLSPRAHVAPPRPRQANLADLKVPTTTTEQRLSAVAAPLPAPAPAPAAAASGPATAALLDRITQGALEADKWHEATKASRKPWLAARQGQGGTGDFTSAGVSPSGQTSPSAQGGRVERVPSVLGGYCVKLPNAATAYRSINGINLAGAGNCP